MTQDLIIVGDCLRVLRDLPSDSVHCIVTSIPYYGLRAYGTQPQVWGGDPDHAHEWGTVHPPGHRASDSKPGPLQHEGNTGRERLVSNVCHCGAWRGELGLEPTLGMFIEHITAIFREARRVLHPSGVCYLNVGDSYFGTGAGQKDTGKASYEPESWPQDRPQPDGVLKAKDMMLVPERLAIALQLDGWWVRSKIAWCKKSVMPESVTDRPTSAWEHIFLFAKSQRYFYDGDAVRDNSVPIERSHLSKAELAASTGNAAYDDAKGWAPGNPEALTVGSGFGKSARLRNPAGANLRNVWALGQHVMRLREDLTPQQMRAFLDCFEPAPADAMSDEWLLGPEPFAGAHFATFPTKIPERAILAGTSEQGACPVCLHPWQRKVEPSPEYAEHLGKDWADDSQDAAEGRGHFDMGDGRKASQRRVKRKAASITAEYRTVGWEPSCKCGRPDVVPCTVLDPFFGAGTSGLVARRLHRRYIGIELNPGYADIAINRINTDVVLGAPFPELVTHEEYLRRYAPATVEASA